MDRTKVPIVLVLSHSQSFCKKLNEMLVRLGFTSIETLEWDDLLCANRDHFNKVFLIPVSQENALRRNLKPGFETMRKMPVLGVVQAHEKNLDIDVLKYCNEIVCWPCSRNEFTLRLERLCAMSGMIPDFTGETKSLENFIDLNLLGNSEPFLKILRQIKKFGYKESPRELIL